MVPFVSLFGGSPASASVAAQLSVAQAVVSARHPQLSAVYQENGATVIRLYESLGAETDVILSGRVFENKTIYEADMSGNIRGTLDKTVTFRPFEIRTFILK